MAFITLEINNVEDAIRAKAMLEAYIQMELALGDNTSKIDKMLSTKVKLDNKVVEPKVTIKESTNTIKKENVENNNSDKLDKTTNKDTINNSNSVDNTDSNKNIEFVDIQTLAKKLVKIAGDNQQKVRYWIAKINIEIGNNKSAKIRNLKEDNFYKVYKAFKNLETFILNKNIAGVTIDKLKENL